MEALGGGLCRASNRKRLGATALDVLECNFCQSQPSQSLSMIVGLLGIVVQHIWRANFPKHLFI